MFGDILSKCQQLVGLLTRISCVDHAYGKCICGILQKLGAQFPTVGGSSSRFHEGHIISLFLESILVEPNVAGSHLVSWE